MKHRKEAAHLPRTASRCSPGRMVGSLWAGVGAQLPGGPEGAACWEEGRRPRVRLRVKGGGGGSWPQALLAQSRARTQPQQPPSLQHSCAGAPCEPCPERGAYPAECDAAPKRVIACSIRENWAVHEDNQVVSLFCTTNAPPIWAWPMAGSCSAAALKHSQPCLAGQLQCLSPGLGSTSTCLLVSCSA